MDLEVAELASEGDVLRDSEILITEEQHLPLEQRLVEECDGLVVEWLSEADDRLLRLRWWD